MICFLIILGTYFIIFGAYSLYSVLSSSYSVLSLLCSVLSFSCSVISLSWSVLKSSYAVDTGFWQNTDPRSTDPLLTPYKINGKMKIKKSPELSMGPDSSSAIDLAYLKLPRRPTRWRFPTFFWMLLREVCGRVLVSSAKLCKVWAWTLQDYA